MEDVSEERFGYEKSRVKDSPPLFYRKKGNDRKRRKMEKRTRMFETKNIRIFRSLVFP